RDGTGRDWGDVGFLPERVVNAELMARIRDGKFVYKDAPFNASFRWDQIAAKGNRYNPRAEALSLQTLFPKEALPTAFLRSKDRVGSTTLDEVLDPVAWYKWSQQRKNQFFADATIIPPSKDNPLIFDLTYTQLMLLTEKVEDMQEKSQKVPEIG